MSHEPKERELVRTVLLAAWGMGTLVLLFSVVLLVYEMIQTGQDPLDLSALRPDSRQAPSQQEPSRTTREVLLYFGAADGAGLAAERRRIEYSSEFTVENIRHALAALIEGPTDPALAPTISPTAGVRSIYLLEDGELVIDFTREWESGQIPGLSAEWTMARSVVATLTQRSVQGSEEAGVRSVRFLLEGSRLPDSFPMHLDLSEPLRPDPQWLTTRAPRTTDD